MPTNNKVLFKFGTAASYAALATKQDNALYFLLDTNELYRGTTPFGQPHIYTGLRQGNATNATTIATLVGEHQPVQGDLTIIRNADNSAEAFIYDASEELWLPIGNTASDSLSQAVTELQSDVADLETLLQSTNDSIDDLDSRLSDLAAVAAGAFHFKGTTDNLESISNPSNGDVYQLGNSEYAWNGTSWVELGSPIDLSAYATTQELNDAVSDLEALIGHMASETEDSVTGETITKPATGIYADLFEHADQIIPLFNGLVSGLVPVDNSNATSAEKAQKFLNALGNWITVTSGGQSTYTDPEGNTYNTVEEYVTYMINHMDIPEYIWESIDSNE